MFLRLRGAEQEIPGLYVTLQRPERGFYKSRPSINIQDDEIRCTNPAINIIGSGRTCYTLGKLTPGMKYSVN